MEETEKYKDLAKKLKALADRGIGGEKTNAETMLNRLLEKHNIKIEEIDTETQNDYYFTIDKTEQDLLRQIVKHCDIGIRVFGIFPESEVFKNGLPGNYMVRCTASQYIEIEAKFEFYNKLYKEELEVFKVAFYKANNILPVNNKSLSAEEWLKWDRINNLSNNITVGQFKTPKSDLPQLKAGKGDKSE